jgi:hypothetical protein
MTDWTMTVLAQVQELVQTGNHKLLRGDRLDSSGPRWCRICCDQPGASKRRHQGGVSFSTVSWTGQEHRVPRFYAGKQDNRVSQVMQSKVSDSLEVHTRTKCRFDEGHNVINCCNEGRVCDGPVSICVGIVPRYFGEDSLGLGRSAALDQIYQQAVTRHDELLNGENIDLGVRSMPCYIPFAAKAECGIEEPGDGAQRLKALRRQPLQHDRPASYRFASFSERAS